MFRIGEFSQIARVTIDTLRHYDALGLLKPVKVDPFTGYHKPLSTKRARTRSGRLESNEALP